MYRAFLSFLLIALYITAPLANANAAESTQAQTRHPIVLIHGVTIGFTNIAGFEYFNGVRAKLEKYGATVYTPAVSNGAELSLTGQYLIDSLEAIKREQEHEKFNLIAHGPSGVSARYAASVRPDLVASVTTVGTPNYGENTDAVFLPLGNFRFFLYKAGDVLSRILHAIQKVSYLPVDTEGVVDSGNYTGMSKFNELHPQGMPPVFCGETVNSLASNGVHYFSMVGNKRITNILDPSDIVFELAHRIEYGTSQQGDGIVEVCRAHWGKVIRDDYPWNYLDEVNQIAGLRGMFSPSPAMVYRNHATRLKLLGL